MNRTRVGIVGAGGRMGRMLLEAALKDDFEGVVTKMLAALPDATASKLGQRLSASVK